MVMNERRSHRSEGEWLGMYVIYEKQWVKARKKTIKREIMRNKEEEKENEKDGVIMKELHKTTKKVWNR